MLREGLEGEQGGVGVMKIQYSYWKFSKEIILNKKGEAIPMISTLFHTVTLHYTKFLDVLLAL